MTHRFTLPLLAALVGSSLAGGVAQARVRLAGDFSSTLPLGVTEKVADPALGLRGKLEWLSPNERLVIGVLGGQVVQPHRLPDEPTLGAMTFGGEVAWIFGPKDWGTRPYIGFQAGYAQLTLTTNTGEAIAEFNPGDSAKTAGGGMFIVPEAGLLVALTKNFGLRFDFRYVYIRSFDEMAIADYRTYSSQSLGLGAGLMLTF